MKRYIRSSESSASSYVYERGSSAFNVFSEIDYDEEVIDYIRVSQIESGRSRDEEITALYDNPMSNEYDIVRDGDVLQTVHTLRFNSGEFEAYVDKIVDKMAADVARYNKVKS